MKTPLTFLSITALTMIAAASSQAVKLESGPGANPTAESTKPTAKGEGANQSLSYGIAEIVKMVEAGVDVPTIETYIQSSSTAYNPSAEDIIQLHEQGVPSSIITGLIRHGKELREKWAQSQPAKGQAQYQQPAPTSSDNTLSAQPTYVPATAPQSYYYYPSYRYPIYYPSYSYYPSFSYFSSVPFYYRYPSCRFQGYHPYVGMGFRYGRSCGNFGWSRPAFHGSVRVGHGGRVAGRCR